MKNEPDKEKKAINDRENLKTYFDLKIPIIKTIILVGILAAN
jgi:hypothetical protein